MEKTIGKQPLIDRTDPPPDSVVHRVLLVEDDVPYAKALRARLESSTDPVFHVEWVDRLQSALEFLKQDSTDAVLLDLFLPDSQGLATLLGLQRQTPNAACVILTGLENTALGLEAVRKGAQDYLVKGRADHQRVAQTLLYSMERHRVQRELQDLSIRDPLTALHNRRGFYLLAEQQLKLSCRTKERLSLWMFDLDGLKQINDTFGHPAGDQALVETADVLRATFRRSDIIARVGGDEFSVLAVAANEGSERVILERFQRCLHEANERRGSTRKPAVSVSVGASSFDPPRPCTLEELVVCADKALYQCKRTRRIPREHEATALVD